MQIAGRQCAVCASGVGTMQGGYGCERCDVVVHQACAPDGTCPTCGSAFLPPEQVHARPTRALQLERKRPAAVSFLAGLSFAGVPLGAVLVVAGWAYSAADPDVAVEAMTLGVMSVVVSVPFGVSMLRGHRWTRLLILYGTPLGMVVELVTGENRFFGGFSVPLFIASCLGYAGSAYLLMRPDVRAFFAKKVP